MTVDSGWLVALTDGILLALTLTALWLGVRLYKLLRTGELGRIWRFIIFGVVLLTFREILRLGDQIQAVPGLTTLERIAETGFMALMCYALWRQWLTFDLLQASRWKQHRLSRANAANKEKETAQDWDAVTQARKWTKNN